MEPASERLPGTGIFPILHFINVSLAYQPTVRLPTLRGFFSDYHEDQLALFIIVQSTLGLALTCFKARALAGRLASSSLNGPPLGRRWLSSFLARHPELKSCKNQRVEAKRLKALTREIIKP